MYVCDVITLIYMMYMMMPMSLYMIHTTLAIYIYIHNDMKMNEHIECHPYHVEFFFYRWRHSFIDPKLSCQGKGSQKDCCSAGPTLVLVDLHPEFMIFGIRQ